ncbi:MAG: Lrp/AsnC family transcriptional regulator [Pseudomonadota bacterium]
MAKLDDTDRQILQCLADDARQPIERLADAVNLSPTPIRRRIRRMEEDGLIRRYSVDVDMKKAGYALTLYVFVKLQSRDRRTIAEFETKVKNLRQIASCALVSGPHDYILRVNMSDMDAYNEFLRSVLAELPGVFGIESNVVIGTVKEEVALPF